MKKEKYMFIKKHKPKDLEKRIVKLFAIIPEPVEGGYVWLEWYERHELYLSALGRWIWHTSKRVTQTP